MAPEFRTRRRQADAPEAARPERPDVSDADEIIAQLRPGKTGTIRLALPPRHPATGIGE